MTVAIHQPNFLPWIGYFYKIYRSDVFVLLDDVQYTKNSFINRNRIKSVNGEQWLTMPVIISGKFGQNINKVEIHNFEKNFKKNKNTIQTNYGKSNYYDEIMSIYDESNNHAANLVTLNEFFIRSIIQYLGINTHVIKSSELKNIEGESTNRLVSICKQLKADKYLAGFGSKKYQDSEVFLTQGIESVVYDFVHPVYNQLWGGFIPNLSIIDFLFNMGKTDFSKTLNINKNV